MIHHTNKYAFLTWAKALFIEGAQVAWKESAEEVLSSPGRPHAVE